MSRLESTQNSTWKTTLKSTLRTTQKTTQIIREMMKANPEISIKEFAAVCGITRDGVNFHIRNLNNMFLIRNKGRSVISYIPPLISYISSKSFLISSKSIFHPSFSSESS